MSLVEKTKQSFQQHQPHNPMILLTLTILALPSVISIAYELTILGTITTLLPTQHRLYRAYELVTSPMADDALRARYIINLCLATLALLALAVVINTFI